jgi:hypothetical protein
MNTYKWLGQKKNNVQTMSMKYTYKKTNMFYFIDYKVLYFYINSLLFLIMYFV